MYMKIHETRLGKIVAVCDDDIIGKILTEKDTVLDLAKYKDFYKGKKSTPEEIKFALNGFSSANIVGKNSVEIIISTGLASHDHIKFVQQVPYIQIYNL